MALATFKDFCIDASDARRLGAFWAVALGRRLEANDADDMVLRGATPAQTVWINQVPEPKTVKNRVHLDLHTADLAALTAAGATVVNDTDFRWVVMADPEGQEFCAFVRDAPPGELLYELAVDCTDPKVIAGWWGNVFGVPVTRDDKGECCSLDGVPGAPFESLTFVSVPEPKTAKNRIHWDVTGSTDALVAAGATLLRPAAGRSGFGDPEPDRRWDVLADPEGNEFCAFPR